MAKIGYNDKVALNVNPDIADENKVTDSDMNEIKNVVNKNYDEFSEVQDAVNGLTTKNYSSSNLTIVSGSQAASAWRTMASNLSLTLNKGVYLFIFNFSVVGSTTLGFVTLRPTINGGEQVRQTIPIQSLAVSSASTSFFYSVNADNTTLTLNAQGYGTQAFTVSSINVKYIKLN